MARQFLTWGGRAGMQTHIYLFNYIYICIYIYIYMRAELGEVTGWLGDLSRSVVAQVSIYRLYQCIYI